MEYKNLPPLIEQLLEKLQASKRLRAHLQIVYTVARELTEAIHQKWPKINIDVALVHFGAATHDIGKGLVPEELNVDGNLHEKKGQQLLLQEGFSPSQSRFAYTHGNWKSEQCKLEDLLVALADKCWKGKRVEALEQQILTEINRQTKAEKWADFLILDEIITSLASKADERLFWQLQF